MCSTKRRRIKRKVSKIFVKVETMDFTICILSVFSPYRARSKMTKIKYYSIVEIKYYSKCMSII